jgi:threonine dehydrogenase-like Zn-dependent dehydrogenase
MLALEYRPSVARFAAARLTRGAPATSALHLTEMRPPRLPGPDWAPVRPRLAGICGSDQAMLRGTASLYLAGLTSAPFVPGHEVVGEVTGGERRGERVVVEPALGCRARGIEPECPECAEGMHALCRHATDGAVSAGLQIGFCRETGGGWSEGLVAHRSQLHAVPADLSDEDAVMVEPLACALHAAGSLEPESAAPVVAVVGAGTIGLLTVAALRATHPHATIVCAAKHRGQELEARRLGADRVCASGALHLEATHVCGARRLVGRGGRELLLGGFDSVLDCVGSGESLEQSVTATRARGTVLLVGMPGRVTADLALAWQREIRLRGVYGYTDDFPAAIDLARRLGPGRLVARAWDLRDHRAALEDAPRASRRGRPKTVFDVREPG